MSVECLHTCQCQEIANISAGKIIHLKSYFGHKNNENMRNTRYRNRSAKCLVIGFFALWPRIALLLATWPSDLTLSFLQIAFGLHADWAMENIQWKLLCNCKSHLELRNKEWTLILRGWWWSWYEEGRQIMTGRSVGEQAIFTPETSRRVDGSFKQVS